MYYAIGDVHGHFDLLCALYSKIQSYHTENFGDDKYSIVLLGDLIDRGPDSKKVLEFIASLTTENNVVLPGNHELMCANALRAFQENGPAAMPVKLWLANGGEQTLASYCDGERLSNDVDIETALKFFGDNHGSLIHALFDQRPPYHLDRELSLLFVHGGVLMDRHFSEHCREDLLWTRNSAFLNDKNCEWIEPDLLVVHGHTPSTRPSIRRRRIGIDTGAFFTGVLTACAIRSATSEPHFLQVKTTN